MGGRTLTAKETGLGLYCHVPFCASTCDFCAFYQEKPQRGDLDRFLDGMERELSWIQPDRPIDTVFWGGGTPGLLPAKDLIRLGEAVLKVSGQTPMEWTVEMAPSTVKPDKLKALKDLGVNRISLGVQSFQDHTLEGLGRLHRPNQIYKAYEQIRKTGFENVNLDLMIALPGQTPADLREDLRSACELDPAHISTYCLTFEEDTALWVKFSKGEIRQDVERDADLYESTWQQLTDAGYGQYEISNFSKPGFECVHNLNTWRMKEWIGVGPSAASQFKRLRYSNVADLNLWLERIEADVEDRENCYHLTEADLLEDVIIFGLRTSEGISIENIRQRFSLNISPLMRSFFRSLEGDGLAEHDARDVVRLTLKGKLLADQIAVKYMQLAS